MTSVTPAEPLGAALLDRALPLWELGFDTETLDLKSDKNCVLGKLYGSFKHGCKLLGLTLDQAIAYGFHAPTGLSKKDERDYYARLGSWWAVATERRMPAYI